MWIKTSGEYYINTNQVMSINYDEDCDKTGVRYVNGEYEELCYGNHASAIIRNILSSTKFMEVQ